MKTPILGAFVISVMSAVSASAATIHFRDNAWTPRLFDDSITVGNTTVAWSPKSSWLCCGRFCSSEGGFCRSNGGLWPECTAIHSNRSLAVNIAPASVTSLQIGFSQTCDRADDFNVASLTGTFGDPAPVPEATSMLLLGGLLCCLAMCLRRLRIYIVSEKSGRTPGAHRHLTNGLGPVGGVRGEEIPFDAYDVRGGADDETITSAGVRQRVGTSRCECEDRLHAWRPADDEGRLSA